MRNFNVRYECLDARDDFRAQMKKGNPLVGSWDKGEGYEVDDELQGICTADMELDDLPADPLSSGPIHKRRMREMNEVQRVMSSMGWTQPLAKGQAVANKSFKPDVFKLGKAWVQEIDTMKQRIIDEKNLNRSIAGQKLEVLSSANGERVPNIVKVIDKSYLDKTFHKAGCSDLVDSTVKEFLLNQEQEHAFRIVANHAICEKPEQLRMYLGGMGGTGKTQVLSALTCFFSKR